METHLFSYIAKSLDIVSLHHKNSRYVGSAKLQEGLVMKTRNKGARGRGQNPDPPRYTGQWIESVTDWTIRITHWGLLIDWVSSHARLADPIRPMPNERKSGHSGLPIALISRLPDWVVQSVLPIAIHRLLHRFYPLARIGPSFTGSRP